MRGVGLLSTQHPKPAADNIWLNVRQRQRESAAAQRKWGLLSSQPLTPAAEHTLAQLHNNKWVQQTRGVGLLTTQTPARAAGDS